MVRSLVHSPQTHMPPTARPFLQQEPPGDLHQPSSLTGAGGAPRPSQPAQWTPMHCSGRDAHTQASTLTEVGRMGAGLQDRFQAGARLFPGALVAPDSTNPTRPQTGGSVLAPALSTLPPGSTDSPSSPFAAPTVRHQ